MFHFISFCPHLKSLLVFNVKGKFGGYLKVFDHVIEIPLMLPLPFLLSLYEPSLFGTILHHSKGPCVFLNGTPVYYASMDLHPMFIMDPERSRKKQRRHPKPVPPNVSVEAIKRSLKTTPSPRRFREQRLRRLQERLQQREQAPCQAPETNVSLALQGMDSAINQGQEDEGVSIQQ